MFYFLTSLYSGQDGKVIYKDGHVCTTTRIEWVASDPFDDHHQRRTRANGSISSGGSGPLIEFSFCRDVHPFAGGRSQF